MTMRRRVTIAVQTAADDVSREAHRKHRLGLRVIPQREAARRLKEDLGLIEREEENVTTD